MSGHQGFDPGLTGVNEWRELDSSQFIKAPIYHRQIEGRILVCVAMAGKMLAAGNYSAVTQALDPLRAEHTDFLRVGGEGAVADYRIFRIRVDVEHRRKIEIDSHQSEFFSGCACGSIREPGV